MLTGRLEEGLRCTLLKLSPGIQSSKQPFGRLHEPFGAVMRLMIKHPALAIIRNVP